MMHDFIKLTNLVDGNAIFVNPNNVESFSNGMNKGTRLRLRSGGAIEVKESPESVNKIIREIGMVYLTGVEETADKMSNIYNVDRYLNTVDAKFKEKKNDI